MKSPILFLVFAFLFAISCKKQTEPAQNNNNNNTHNNPQDTTKHPSEEDSFVVYTILKGKNYMEHNSYPACTLTTMHFAVIFDSSCIYKNVDSINQYDINKLMGFADCQSFHQTNSARIGWNWLNDSIHLHAYCYVASVRVYKELGRVPLHKKQDCWIKVLNSKYIFILNGKADTIDRGCTEVTAMGYKLYPYFGGDEVAPNDIHIKIREY